MTVNGGTYTSNGSGSPAVYCTADITAKDAQLTANSSEAVCIEGLNSLKLTDCSLTGKLRDFYSISVCLKAVFGILMFCKQ